MKLSYEQRQVARRLLKRLLPDALEAAKRDDGEAIAGTAVAEGMHSHLTLEKLDGVAIYEGEHGGWHADVVFRDMPPGVPGVMGTPVGTPLPTRQAAQDMAPVMLRYVVRLALTKPAAPRDPVFEYHGGTIQIPAHILQSLYAAGFAESGYTAERAVQRVAEIEADLFPDGFSVARYEQLTEDENRRLIAVMTMALATGVFRYPVPQPGPPRGADGEPLFDDDPFRTGR